MYKTLVYTLVNFNSDLNFNPDPTPNLNPNVFSPNICFSI